MLIVNTENIQGKNYEAITLVTGACIMSKNIGKDLGSSLRNMVGGEMKAYMTMLNEATEKAIAYMQEKAEKLGADAVVNVRLASSSIVQGGAEIVAYGTAVKFV